VIYSAVVSQTPAWVCSHQAGFGAISQAQIWFAILWSVVYPEQSPLSFRISYVLENRPVVPFHSEIWDYGDSAVDDYPSQLLETLLDWRLPIPQNPTVVVLTLEIYNSAYFERLIAQQIVRTSQVRI